MIENFHRDLLGFHKAFSMITIKHFLNFHGVVVLNFIKLSTVQPKGSMLDVIL